MRNMCNIWKKMADTSQFIISLILISGQCHSWYKSCSLSNWWFLVPLYWSTFPILPDYFPSSLSSLTTLYHLMFLCFGLAVSTLMWKSQQYHGKIRIKFQGPKRWAGSKWISRQGVCYNELFQIFAGQILIILPAF